MIQLQNICIRAGEFQLTDVSFSIPSGGCGVLMGRTGSGKTTILESIIGLRRCSSGSIRICGTDVTRLNPALRGIGYVPQDGALFSKMNVRDHLAFALLVRRTPKKQIAERVDELSTLLGITHLLDRTPRGLSGGEAQRVALGRALSFRPKVLCLDEPLSALDSETRHEMCELLDSVRQQTHVTTLYVTHNPQEAEILGDHLLRIDGGRIVEEKWLKPAQAEVNPRA
ncbi:MAG TPA: ABC transporter ATP-binding protein [Planctomycetes bacterium]|nr:ABC transporter ATP-binding protein [Fuerstiella sp.]HIK95283.1 ABC transporter ATP-binding protein [Planctomycetota bacterium]